MWFLTNIKTEQRFYLLHNKTQYTVSRKADLGDLALTDDDSISRSHAALHPERDHVKLVDTGSKYGTFINGNIETDVAMAKSSPVQLRENDKIRFGRLESVWRLDRLVINSLSTTLSVDEKRALKNNLTTLNGTLLTDWNDSCTHLTIARLSINMKVLHGLAGTVPIVTPAYWTAYIAAAQAGRPDAPDANAYRPPLAEEYITAEHVSIVPNVERRRLFAHKEFVFMLQQHAQRYELCVRLAGGRCFSLDRKKIARRSLLKPSVCVVQYTPSTQSQTSDDIGQVSQFLSEHNLRTIPESEIGLALLHCSTRKYCNAAYRIDGEFEALRGLVTRTPSTILAEQTEQQSATVMAAAAAAAATSVEVPDSVLAGGSSESIEQAVAAEPVNKPSIVYDSAVSVVSRKRAISPSEDRDEDSATKRSRLLDASLQMLDDGEDDELLSSISQQVEEAEQRESARNTPKEPIQPAQTSAPANDSQSQRINTSGFIARETKTAPSKPALSAPVAPAGLSDATRKRAHVLLLANDSDDDDDSDDDANDRGAAPKLFQFNNAAPLPKRSRRSENRASESMTRPSGTQSTFVDSQMSITACDGAGKSQPHNFNQTNETNCSKTSGHHTTALYSRRRNASALDLSAVQPVRVSLLTGWLSKTSIKCEPKPEIEDVDGSICVDRKIVLKADGSIDEREDSKAWVAQLRGGFEVRVCKVRLEDRSFGAAARQAEIRSNVTSSKGTKNFKAFVKKYNYQPQTVILPTKPALLTLSNAFDF